MKSRNNMHKLWSVMPQDIDILITHGPPKGVRDLSENMNGQLEQCGDLSLMKWVASFRPKAHLFGHIHDMSGINNQGKSLYSKCPTIFSNGACVHDGKFDIGLTSLGNVITLKKQTMAQQTAVSKMETTQTAVEWLFQQIPFEWTSKKSAFEAFQQAKAMEKEQINDAVIYGLDEDGHTGDWKISVAQNYYNKTYNK